METKNIYKALADFQQEVPVIHKGTKGYGYSYSDLPTIFEVINPLLKKHGLGFTQLPTQDGIETILFHIESGQEIRCVTPIPEDTSLKGQNQFQILGSAITYIRRYALSSILGLVTDKDTDAATKPAPAKEFSEKDIKQVKAKLATLTTKEEIQKYYKSNPEFKTNKAIHNLFHDRALEISGQ